MRKARAIVLAGNPNVGKSTVFNALTGLRQHTGNWPGKTVSAARGTCVLDGETFTVIDTPGAYSLRAHSAEEEAAMEAICFGRADAVIVVCDAACLERNMNLLYQVMEITDRTVLCVNLLDEAEKRGVRVDLKALSQCLGIPAVGTCARDGTGLKTLLRAARDVMEKKPAPRKAQYPEAIERAVLPLSGALAGPLNGIVNARFAALRLMENDACFRREAAKHMVINASVETAIEQARRQAGMNPEEIAGIITESVYRAAEEACAKAVQKPAGSGDAQLKWDRRLAGWLGVPVMLALLSLVFFITLKGANWPSAWLAAGFAELETLLRKALEALGLQHFWTALLTEGAFRTMGKVTSVMLPPMAIFFPLFTLLEDAGYLPRVAFTLDGVFERCHACGKQALTMCMGCGCNAVGVAGCRIIDSPRERMIAMLTNCFIPCNGRFPALFVMLTLFFAGGGLGGALLSAGLLTGLAALAVGITLLASWALSVTVLKGVPSSYTLELPPYRRPQFGRVIARSVLDRTVFMLGRAVSVAAPAGVIIFLLSHVQAGGQTLLSHITVFLNPFGRLMGLDGVILAGFLLGFPANEIVLPMIVMAYTAGGGLQEVTDLNALGEILRAHGWTALTALNLMLFSLFHFPCSTTLLTIRKETGSAKWTAFAFALPTCVGMVLCMLTGAIAKYF
ncbi:MAG: ferrous iron transport protein B [Clostridia bacterium]|nr:ferrous iron transport protein B [Clostridia bacterium]